ncbi:mCG146120, partial [Mus musculus]
PVRETSAHLKTPVPGTSLGLELMDQEVTPGSLDSVEAPVHTPTRKDVGAPAAASYIQVTQVDL